MHKVVKPVAAIGVDYGGTELKAVLGNAVEVIGDPVRSRLGRVPKTTQIVGEIAAVVESLAARAEQANVAVAGVCLVIPGRVNPILGKGEFSENLGWTDFSIGPELEAALGMPIHLEHDVYAGALAEFTIGAGRGVGSGVFVPVGTGLAASFLLDSRIWRGATRFAGEIGQFRNISSGDVHVDGRRVSVESFASGRGIERAYAELIGGNENVEAKEIVARAIGGDEAACVVWQNCINTLANALATLTLTLDVEVIVVGGGLSQAGTQLMDPLASAMVKELKSLRDPPELRLATLGQMAGARGAALHALVASAPSSSNAVTAILPIDANKGLEVAYQAKFMLAFDHRASTAAELFNCETVSSEQWEVLSDAKTVIAEAAVMAQNEVGQLGEVSVLVDLECGQAAVREAQFGGVATALALEVSGQRRLELLDEGQLEASKSLLELARWGKVLLRWNPSDPVELKESNLAALRQARSICDSVGIDLLLELIVPSTALDMGIVADDAVRYRSEVLPRLVAVAVGEITECFGQPHLWKLQGVTSASSAAEISAAACVDGVVPPIVILGAGASSDEIVSWFRAGSGVRGYAGFAIGRSIWKSSIAGLLSGQLDRKGARDEIAACLIGYVNDYIVAAHVSRVAGCR